MQISKTVDRILVQNYLSTMSTISNNLTQGHYQVSSGCSHDPFTVLGRHKIDGEDGESVTLFAPHLEELRIGADQQLMTRIENTDFFIWQGPSSDVSEHYRLAAVDKTGHGFEFFDPYSFEVQIPEFDLHLFSEGKHWHAYRHLGATHRVVDGLPGVLFATWAPNAERVSVIGDFNQWDGLRHQMRSRGSSGVWELFIPELEPDTCYKFEIRNRHSGAILEKTDPYAQAFEHRPRTASRIIAREAYEWQDSSWMTTRDQFDWQHKPVSVYEVHLGSWQRDEKGGFLNYRDIAHRLVDYLQDLNFTHIELLPITEHPLDDSWGYQVTGYYAPTSRFGSPEDFRYFVDYLHQNEIGVLLDWVPAHFPKDQWALGEFDGTPLYEHADPRKGEHRDWGTKIFNYGRSEVKNFLISSALFWIEEFHIDGIRVDAVASMLYLDYSREAGDWVPNEYGGRENLEAIEFLQHLNSVIGSNHPGVLMVAEESTSWPQVSRPTYLGGLGFSIKWNMGWMHDTLDYMSKDPVYRHFHHNKLTFGMLYSFTENFMLPFSHDEVVHGKGSMIGKMPGDRWQQFANLRLLYTYMYTYPGKKLLFMGSELAQFEEWNHHAQLEMSYLNFPDHAGIHRIVGDLNQLYRAEPVLHGKDFSHEGFEWIDCNDAQQSVVSFMRKFGDEFAVIILNFTPVTRDRYRVGVPVAGRYTELFNSDSKYYAGSDVGNWGGIFSDSIPWMGMRQSLSLSIPPLAAVILKLEASE